MRGSRRIAALAGASAAALVAALTIGVGVVGGNATAQTTEPSPPEPSTTSTTAPPSSSTTSTTAPPSTTTTRPPDTPATAPTTAPPSPRADGLADRVLQPSTADAAAARAAVASLTSGQRELLRRLQSTRDDLATARAALVDLAARVTTAQGRLDDADRTVAAATDDAARARRRLAQLRARTASMASALYQHLSDAVLLDAVNTADRTTVNQVRTYARAPQETLDRLVARARTTEHREEDARARAERARAAAADALRALRTLADRQRDALTAAEQASTDAQAAVTDALGSNVALLGQVADPHFGADDITAALVAAEAGDADPATLVGAVHLPVPDAPLGSPYGIRVDPLSGALGYHPGIDFEAGAGTPVHAAAGGTVVMAGDCGGYGNCVVVDHGQSLGTVSAHLSKVLVVVGQPVTDGQVVGLVGSTGMSTGPHLHFEVRFHGVPIDPLLSLVA